MTDESPEAAFEERRRTKHDRAAFAMRYARYLERVGIYERVWPHLEQADGFQPVAYCGTPKQAVESRA